MRVGPTPLKTHWATYCSSPGTVVSRGPPMASSFPPLATAVAPQPSQTRSCVAMQPEASGQMYKTDADGIRRRFLFRASCVAIVAEAMSFGVRAEIMDTLSSQFHLTNEQIAWVAGAAFWGFTVSMFAGGQVCEVIGMRWQIAAAFACHVSGVLLTLFANGFGLLYAGTLAIGLANGLVEATANPLIATIYPERKTDRLNALHVGYPG